ncbi:tetratricopeptide repeat protein [Muricauda sp. SCSIO 64092]|uniref:tetratricopeptide repeat protein n=1 Tax=Allomuricauda sp. SCSIO 64092 TaxID=2908842 RepID=UPI001FF0F1E9|nr:tetratricopeptide repeat protein [Muricauda sp. SCSIO 64092]UOY08617.1 tetratricopeptide repeat protein [Muricauda sp. SCSIO 64092]
MPYYFKTKHNHNYTVRPRTILGLIFIMACLVFVSFTPQNAELDTTIREFLELNPKSYQKIDGALRPFKRDTVALNAILSFLNASQHPEALSYALNQKGTVYRNLSQFKKAVALHQNALDVAREVDNKEFIVFSLNMLGVVYTRTDAIKTALDYNQRALEVAESIDDPSYHIKRNVNISLNGIGNLYKALGQYDLAISQFERALELEGQLGNKLGLAIDNQNIGECLELKGNLEEALKRYQKSLALNEEIKNNYGRVICKNAIAQVYLKQGSPNKALELLEQLAEPISKIKDKFIWSSILSNTGWANMEVNNYDIAERKMKEGLKMAAENTLPSQVIYAQRLLSQLEAKRGDYKKALDYYKEAEKFDNELKDDRNLRYINDLILRYETEKRDNQISNLANENELVKLRLRRNQTTILVSTLVIGLVGTILFIMYRQYQSNYEKRVMGLEQNMLRSQMNPHFLFNSLNSIKLYIINNDKKNAVHYLNKFSKLVRRILDGSSLKETTLAEELETVELYLNIENIRFSEGIAYSINVEDGIDTETTKIPSLVLQPFLENAIWHGLSAKEGEKNLWLNISRKDDVHMLISIIDNGVGRATSEKIKENRVLKRKSVGIDITKERLANFAKDYQYGFDVEIIDLYDDEGNPKGTKVVLEIPTI